MCRCHCSKRTQHETSACFDGRRLLTARPPAEVVDYQRGRRILLPLWAIPVTPTELVSTSLDFAGGTRPQHARPG
jgi:hypothetical protein